MESAMADMPSFNIMGLILGGRGYAANYFGQRDQLEMQNAQRAERDQFAQGLLGPDYGANANAAYGRAMDNPYDRRAQMGLWGRMYGGPESAAALGNSMLEKSISSIYGKEATAFEDELAKQRIRLTADQELRVDETKRARDTAMRKNLIDMVYGPDGQNAQNQQMRNAALKQLGISVPDGMDAIPGPNGQLAFRPAPGTPQFREMLAEFQPQQNILSGLKNLQAMAEQGNGSAAAWETERQTLMLDIQKARKLGALDEGTLDFMDRLIPGSWDNAWTTSPTKMGQTKERLRVLIARNEANLKQTADRWMMPVDQVPDRAAGWDGGINKPVPKGPARAAVNAMDERASELRARDRARGGPITTERARKAREAGDAAGRSGSAIGGMVPRGSMSGGAW
jgi:hypothetical protein